MQFENVCAISRGFNEAFQKGWSKIDSFSNESTAVVFWKLTFFSPKKIMERKTRCLIKHQEGEDESNQISVFFFPS